MAMTTRRAAHLDCLGLPACGRHTDDDIKRAYRQRALIAHPDKPTGDAAAFRQLAAARDALLRSNAICSGAAAQPTRAAARPRTASAAKAAAPLARFTVPPAQGFLAPLRDGTMYEFDAAPLAFGLSGLRHGAVVTRFGSEDGTAGTAGRIVGVAATQTVYWFRQGAAAATPFGRLVTLPKFQVHAKARAAPAAPAPQPSPIPSHTHADPATRSTLDHPRRGAADAIQAEEVAARRRLGAAVETFFLQAAWVHSLPPYSAKDKHYNKDV